jgi:predicted enzyme related to lactoylglutathione lyase
MAERTQDQIGMGLVLDCNDPSNLARFWAAALDYVYVGDAGNYAALFPNGRSGPKLLLQKVAEPKQVKNRMHLDIEVADIAAEADRLEALGATRVREEQLCEHGSNWILMNDPEGNEFCVCDGGASHTER